MSATKLVAMAAVLFAVSGAAFAGCETGHWIQSKSDDGSIIIIEDGSVWQVDPVDTIDSSLWLVTDEIVACDDKLIDTDDGTTVEATHIK